MTKLIREILVGKQKVKQYDFSKTKTIAGSCPDCIHVVAYYPEHKFFKCTNIKCSFVANDDGYVIYSTAMRKEGIVKPLEIPSEENNVAD